MPSPSGRRGRGTLSTTCPPGKASWASCISAISTASRWKSSCTPGAWYLPPLARCEAYVYLWKGHPLAGRESICLEDLPDYPCLSFEQGAEGSFYYAEEILSTAEYPKTIKCTDRATMLNLMVGLLGYTLCSGIICEELNGADFVTVPFAAEADAVGKSMVIGYIARKNFLPGAAAQLYIRELDRYLGGDAHVSREL